MHRIDTPTAQQDKFGQGKNGFTNGDPATGRLATHVNSDIWDALQEEICTVIEKAQIKLNKSQHAQLYQAVRKVAEDEANKAKIALIDGISLECNTLNKVYQTLRTVIETTVSQAKTALIDGAPSTLNTLNQLSQALGHQPTFSATVTEQLNQKLSKQTHGTDIPDKNAFVRNLGLSETVKNAKNALDKTKGGLVNGDVFSSGIQITLKGDNRKHFGIHNQDGQSRMWLYKDKGGDGIRLNNGIDGGGDWVFHKNGHFHSPGPLHAGGATYQSDGNIQGSVWGGHLYQWITSRLTEALKLYITRNEVNRAFISDIRLGAEMPVPVTSFFTIHVAKAPSGCCLTGFSSTSGSSKMFYKPIQKNIHGQWITIGQG